MKKFLDENFLLETTAAERLYHEYARDLPIIDYHNHLPPDQIARNRQFESLTQLWLNGDHYKWRAMRASGVDEQYITGQGSDWEKFEKWACTLPYTLRNPLYHWSHLELQRYFGIDDLLTPRNARAVYDACNAQLQTEQYRAQGLLKKMNAEIICTTDDPLDSLLFHQQAAVSGLTPKMLPAFRPDKAIQAENIPALNIYIDRMEEITGSPITHYDDYLTALKNRHDYFAARGCTVADHGLDHLYAEAYTGAEVDSIFKQIRRGKELQPLAIAQFKSALLFAIAEWNHQKGWVQQYHLGALRNNNTRLLSRLGPDTGFDSIGDFSQAKALSAFLNRLDSEDKLARTIIYTLNPADNEMAAAMTGNFNDGQTAGKVQFGAAWWFLDQKDGIIRQLNALSNMGLLSRMAGMLTDSRSFMSFPRHEYFRRILCNLLGNDMTSGELPDDFAWTGKIVQDICYYNAKTYFNW